MFLFVCIHDVVCTSALCQTSRRLFCSTNRLSGKLRRKFLFTVIKTINFHVSLKISLQFWDKQCLRSWKPTLNTEHSLLAFCWLCSDKSLVVTPNILVLLCIVRIVEARFEFFGWGKSFYIRNSLLSNCQVQQTSIPLNGIKA